MSGRGYDGECSEEPRDTCSSCEERTKCESRPVCWRLGEERRVPAQRALADAPQTLLLKLKPLHPGARACTFFLARQEDAAQCARYAPDSKARAPPKRKLLASAADAATLRALGTSGSDLAPPTPCARVSEQPNILRGLFDWKALGLRWTLSCDFRLEADTIECLEATLRVEALDDAANQAAPNPPPRKARQTTDTQPSEGGPLEVIRDLGLV